MTNPTTASAEPIEPGWYAYSGGAAQTMVFHLSDYGQWSAHVDNGTADNCVWGYIEQALGVWDLVRLDPARTVAADRELARVTAAVEALADGPHTLINDCGMAVRWVDPAELRAALSSANTTALDRERAKAAGEALREAADRWTQGEWSDVMLPKPTPPAVPVIAYSNRMGDWLRDRAAAVSPEGGDA